MRNRKRKNSERKEVISTTVLMLLVVVIIFTPYLSDRYSYKHAQHIFNKRAEQYGKEYTVTAYHVKGGETVYSIYNSLYEEYAKEYDISERYIYYGSRSIKQMKQEAEASCIYSGTVLYVPVIK